PDNLGYPAVFPYQHNLIRHYVYQFARNNDDLSDRLVMNEFLYVIGFDCDAFKILISGISRYIHLLIHFAVDMYDDFNFRLHDFAFVEYRPCFIRNRFSVSKPVTEFFCQMRCYRREHFNEALDVSTAQLLLPVAFIDEYHELRNCRVETKRLIVACNLPECFVIYLIKCSRLRVHDNLPHGTVLIDEQAPYTVQEPASAVKSVFTPIHRSIKRPHEHFIESQSICTM